MSVHPSAAPWWEATADGARLMLGFVMLDRQGSTREWDDLPEDEVARRRTAYRAGVDAVAREMDAAPLVWKGDGTTVFVYSAEEPAAQRAFITARLVWERLRIELNLSVRLAVNAAPVIWRAETGRIDDRALDLCGHLESDAPVNSIAVTEDVYLVLPDSERERLAPLGTHVRDRIPAYVFPVSAARARDPARFADDPDQRWWGAFRRYANGPDTRTVRHAGLRRGPGKARSQLDLLDVFVPPRAAMVGAKSVALDPEYAATVEAPPGPGGPPTASTSTFVFDFGGPVPNLLRQHRHLIILGEPGSGKTTCLRWLAVLAARGRLGWAAEIGMPQRLLPLPVSVGRLAEVRRALGDTASVQEALAEYYRGRSIDGQAEERLSFLRRALDAGECLLLLDGLDEVGADDRDNVRSWLESFAAGAARNRIVVSSRPAGYPGFALDAAPIVRLEPFSDDEIRVCLERYFAAAERGDNGQSEPFAAWGLAGDLVAKLRRTPQLLAMARNPLILSVLARIQREDVALPEHRVLVYERVAEWLCTTWVQARRMVPGEPGPVLRYETDVVPFLGHLALRMAEDFPAGVAPRDFVLARLVEAVERRGTTDPGAARQLAEEFLSRAADEVGLLVEHGGGQWGFLHAAFREFFAAAALHAEDRFEQAVDEHLYEPSWEEVIRLGAAYYVLVQKRSAKAEQFVEHLLRAASPAGWTWLGAVLRKQLGLASLVAADLGEALPLARRDAVAREFFDWTSSVPIEICERFWRQIAGSALACSVGPLYVAAIRDGDPRAAWRGAHAAVALGLREAAEPLQEIVREALDIAGRSQRDLVARPPERAIMAQTAVWALASLGAYRSFPLLRRAVEEENPQFGRDAAHAIAQLWSPYHDLLVPEAVRQETARAFGQPGLVETADVLRRALAARNPGIRANAALALWKMGAAEAWDDLVALARQDSDAEVRTAAAFALRGFATTTDRPIPADIEWPSALGSTPVPATVPATTSGPEDDDVLLSRLRSDSVSKRVEAIRELGRRRSLVAALPLVRYFESADEHLPGSLIFHLNGGTTRMVVPEDEVRRALWSIAEAHPAARWR